jgi:hypothetical protein
MKRLWLVLLIGCGGGSEPVEEPTPVVVATVHAMPTPAPSLPPVVIDLSNDSRVIEVECDDCDEVEADVISDSTVTIVRETDSDDVPDVQDRCPDLPDEFDGDVDGCPDHVPME